MEILFITIGGFSGAICRFFISKSYLNKKGLPYGTMLVNLLGAFLLGLLYGLHIKGHLYALLGVGFMGAFTTFSTFKLESELFRKSKKMRSFYTYIFISYSLGILLTTVGFMLGNQIS